MILCANPKEQYLTHKTEIQNAINKVLESGWYILGQEVKLFENEFSNFVGTKYTISVASGTDALFLALKALNIGTGDEVITVSHTATATVSAIKATGATPIMVDIEKEYFTIDIEEVKKRVSNKTKAIIAVHIYGQPCDMDALIKISNENNIDIIEDCAQASGASYKGKELGSIGTLGCFSFFPTKNLGAIGDGGAITTNCEKLYNKLLKLRQYGWDENRDSEFSGYNSRLDELQAAILRVKLKYLKQDTKKRNDIAKLYYEALKNSSLILPKVRDNCYHSFHLFVVRLKNRNQLKEYLKSKNILAMIHYEKPVHLQEAFTINHDLNCTENIAGEILSLPMYPELSEKDIKYISTKCLEVKES
ncbi:Glutamine--scyllo-inositol transaminase [Arcobacter nitrofigilis DSM 7299]|uniref:Glutamine--scyllo-inositol transaminase n=1 Tax=Arcobacter nitrofigilis (strain ATCC 33309 / DSM 7299 / CCUG 15893 / LMG 7604 / NCTC 12251 / CI) TaxID=572480 RepID=D5V6D6_ARCNC|nr:DegT/DnrJ/EryC1/StrS family aminotransferase [Arcobacter nitrofigilis]ADG94206.1 Glutamine--scyllo-inositol transaminase [Arcobacter nitrofigilis DSM 7299]